MREPTSALLSCWVKYWDKLSSKSRRRRVELWQCLKACRPSIVMMWPSSSFGQHLSSLGIGGEGDHAISLSYLTFLSPFEKTRPSELGLNRRGVGSVLQIEHYFDFMCFVVELLHVFLWVVHFCLEKNKHIFCDCCVLSSHDDSHG